jgi:hypothetical protein
LFEAGYRHLSVTFPHIGEAFDLLDDELKRTPFSAGEETFVFEGRRFFLTTTPKTNRYPALRALFEIEDPRVICWHVCERRQPTEQPSATIHILRNIAKKDIKP